MTALAFDLLLASALVIVAAWTLLARDALRAVVLLVVFGLLMALAWARLHAPDVAMAEATVGAGLTGALLFDAIGGRPPARRDP